MILLLESRRIAGLLFDLDGVLADSEPCHVRAWQTVLPRYGVHPDEAAYRDGIGVADSIFAAGLRERWKQDLPVEEVLREKRAAYQRLLSACLRSYPGVREAILALPPCPGRWPPPATAPRRSAPCLSWGWRTCFPCW